MALKTFFSKLFKDTTFDQLPNALIDQTGVILSSNKEFQELITPNINIKLRDVFKIRSIDNQIIATKDGYNWHIIHKQYYNGQYRIWVIPQMHESPSIWSTVSTPMLMIDTQGCIKYVNKTAMKDPFNAKVGDQISKYCMAFNQTMLDDGATYDVLWNDNLCKIHIYQKDSTIWLISIDNINDLARIDTELQRANHLRSIGQITSSVVHDFRNILAVIDGYCQLILEESDISAIKDYTKQIHSTTQNASSMVKELLRFTRSNAGIDLSTSPGEVLNSLRSVIQKVVGNHINVTFSIKDELSRIGLSPNDLERIILNIIMNAKDAMNSTGTLKINLFKKYISEPWKINECYLRRGFYLVMSFDDTGVGITPENLAKIFTPFFTTKKTGNGLGLSTILSMLRDISGGLQVLSTVGKGTRIMAYMPIVQHTSYQNKTEETKSKTIPHQFKGTIAVVEDNEDVLEICSIILTKDGYTVHKFSTAESAISFFGTIKNIDLLITDANLPKMNGSDMVIAAKKLCKISNILVISGYEENILKEKFGTDVHFLPKPVPLSELREKVHNILHGAGI